MDMVMMRAAALAEQQYGVIHRMQLQECGGTRWTWRRWQADGIIVPAGSSTARFAAAPKSFEQRLMAAMLDAGPRSVVSFRAACWLFRYDGVERGPVELTVPPDHRYRSPHVIVHVSAMTDDDVVEYRGFRVTSPVRTVIDMAQFGDRTVLEHVLDSALRDPSVDELDVRRRLAEIRRQGRGGVVLLDEVLDGRPTGGLHSVLERALLRIVRAAGLPEPRTQAVFRLAGRVRRVDFIWDDLVVEVSGHRTHSSRHQRRRDAERQRSLVAEGLRVVEFTSDEVFADGLRVGEELRMLLVPRSPEAIGVEVAK